MFKKIFLYYIFLNLLIGNSNFETEVFNKYSIQNIIQQKSIYSIALTKPINEPINYHFNWMPTSNFAINTKLINNFKNDNKVFFSFNFGLLFKNNIIGMSINSLKFDNVFNNKRWNTYFLVQKINVKNWTINTMLAYNFNKEFSLVSISNYFEKRIFKYIDINFGLNITKIDNFLIKPYFGIKYNL